MERTQRTRVAADLHSAVRVGLIALIEPAPGTGDTALVPPGRQALDEIATQLEARLAPLLDELLLGGREGCGLHVRATLALLRGRSGRRARSTASGEPTPILEMRDDSAKRPAGASNDEGRSELESRALPTTLVEPLSEREQEVLRLVATGLSNKDLAARLFLSVGTVKQHLHHINGKLGTTSRTHAMARAREFGIL